jgi:F420-dependent oxidoreductase-like protein
VIEGFHGVPYDAPLARTREIVEICRMVWRREPVVYQGEHYQIPLPEGQGTGLGRPLKIINHPVRSRIPVVIAAIGPRNVALAAEIAEAWQPIFFHPEKAADAWGDSLADGLAKRDPALGPLDIMASVPFAITDYPEAIHDLYRGQLALYIGGMGARGQNFYTRLATRYGYGDAAKVVQDLYLSGRKEEAAAEVPDDLVRDTSLVGPLDYVRERVAAFAKAGVTTLHVTALAPSHPDRVNQIEQLRSVMEG